MKPKSKYYGKAIISNRSLVLILLFSAFLFVNSQASETRHALHGIRWPTSNPKCLNVEFGQESGLENAIASTTGDVKTLSSTRDDRHISSNEAHDPIREKVNIDNSISYSRIKYVYYTFVSNFFS